GEVAAPLVRLEQDLVREHVERLLRFTVDIAFSGRTQTIRQRALVHPRADPLARARDRLDEQAQVGVDELLVALARDQELAERDSLHGGVILFSGARTRRRPGETRRAASTPAPCRQPRTARRSRAE